MKQNISKTETKPKGLTTFNYGKTTTKKTKKKTKPKPQYKM